MLIVYWGDKTLWHFHIEMRRGFKGACWCGRNRVKICLKSTYNVQQINGNSNLISTIARILCCILLVWIFYSFLSCCNEHLIGTKFSNHNYKIQWPNLAYLEPYFYCFFFQGFQQGLIHPCSQCNLVKFKIVVSCHCWVSLFF